MPASFFSISIYKLITHHISNHSIKQLSYNLWAFIYIELQLTLWETCGSISLLWVMFTDSWVLISWFLVLLLLLRWKFFLIFTDLISACRMRYIIPTFEDTTMSKGINQAITNKVIVYERSFQDDEKESNVHPMKYDWIENENLLADQICITYYL